MEDYKELAVEGKIVSYRRLSDLSIVPNNADNKDFIELQNQLKRGEARVIPADPPVVPDPRIAQAKAVFLNPLALANDRLDALGIVMGLTQLPVSAPSPTVDK